MDIRVIHGAFLLLPLQGVSLEVLDKRRGLL